MNEGSEMKLVRYCTVSSQSSSLINHPLRAVRKAVHHHIHHNHRLRSLKKSGASRSSHLILTAAAARQLFPTSCTASRTCAMSAPTLKRKHPIIQPKIHVKGAKHPLDNKVHVNKECKKSADESDCESEDETRAHPNTRDSGSDDEEQDLEQSGSDGEDGSPVKKIKSKEERQAEKKAAKMKKFEKVSEKNKRTIFVGNLPSTCTPRVCALFNYLV